jgi:hypothetical protein
MSVVYPLTPSGPVFPAAEKANPEITLDKHKTLFLRDLSAAERNGNRKAFHHSDYA